MTYGIVYSSISQCSGIMLICCRYKHISYKPTKKCSFLKVQQKLMNLSPVMEETDNLTRLDREARPVHLAYRNAIANIYVNNGLIFLVTAVAYNKYKSSNLTHFCHIQRRKKPESARGCGAVKAVQAEELGSIRRLLKIA